MTNPLLEYIDTPSPARPPQQAPVNTGGAMKFHGEVAHGYDAKRENTAKWKVEQEIIEGWLSELSPGTRVLDAPVGSGRFLPHMVKQQLEFVGLDIQPDMLVQAALKVLPLEAVEAWVAQCNQQDKIVPLRIKGMGALMVGDVRKTGAPDKAVDVAINCRITRWMMGNFGPQGVVEMLREMQRVASKKIILTARVYGHQFAVTEDLIKSALDGWKITRDAPGYELAYRILMLEPTSA